MIGTARPRKYTYILPLCLFTLLLAIAWPAPAAAQPSPDRRRPEKQAQHLLPLTPHPGRLPARPPPPPHPRRAAMTAPPLPRQRRAAPSRQTRQAATVDTLTLAQTLAEYELIKALAPNRIIFHAATPIQLCKVDDGLQIYFISRKGKTRLGPWIPSFAELAAKHPDGDEGHHLRTAATSLNGKRVKIDYLPNRKKNSRRHLLRRQRARQKQTIHLPRRRRTRHHLRRLVAQP